MGWSRTGRRRVSGLSHDSRRAAEELVRCTSGNVKSNYVLRLGPLGRHLRREPSRTSRTSRGIKSVEQRL